MCRKKDVIYMITTILLVAVTLVGCSSGISYDKAGNETSQNNNLENNAVTNLSQVDMTKWQYNADDNVYYQIGIQYCENPADLTYEKLAIFIPGDYMKAKDNGDGTFTCEINKNEKVGNYTAETAPVVIPVNTPGYMACSALTEYTDVSDYTDEGFIYVHAGCRGRDEGAPAGVTDLKAAIRYIRYNDGVIAGDMDRIFSFGMSGGGAQSALLGSTGDSEMYDSYLKAIGAVEGVSDAVAGSMCWCPITSLDSADEAYEWNMGSARTNLSEDEQKISDELTAAYAEYINKLGIKDEEGNVLTLEQSEDGRYQSGSYYEYMKGVIENSLNNFLSDTTFPYNADENSKGGGMRGTKGDGAQIDGIQKGDKDQKLGDLPDGIGGLPDGMQDKDNDLNIEDMDNINRKNASGDVTISGTYETAQDYIDALNAANKWVTYDAETNTATITSIADFAKAVKPASKGLGAFDQLDGGQGENTLFGYGDGNGAHFDEMLAEILEGTEYETAYSDDLTKTDSEGNTAEYRVNMYSPLYFLMESSDGYGKSNVARYWRIRTGAWQSDTSITTETNLALALSNYEGVRDVDYETVWGQKHTEAERSGNSTENFISWVNECLESEK